MNANTSTASTKTKLFVTPELVASIERLAAAEKVSIHIQTRESGGTSCGEFIRIAVFDKTPKQAKSFMRVVKSVHPDLNISLPKDRYRYLYSEWSSIPTGTEYLFSAWLGPVPA